MCNFECCLISDIHADINIMLKFIMHCRQEISEAVINCTGFSVISYVPVWIVIHEISVRH
jgi:hypothetical protein